ncbi:MAG: hypothetical protein WCT49_05520 [Candidatus Paceibacterota bacterium]
MTENESLHEKSPAEIIFEAKKLKWKFVEAYLELDKKHNRFNFLYLFPWLCLGVVFLRLGGYLALIVAITFLSPPWGIAGSISLVLSFLLFTFLQPFGLKCKNAEEKFNEEYPHEAALIKLDKAADKMCRM